MRWTSEIGAVVAVALTAVAVETRAAEGATSFSADAIGRFGPAGAMLTVGAARRWSEADGPSALARGRYVQLGAAAGVNPAYAQGSLATEWVPLAPLQLRLAYDAYGFFGANGSLFRLPSKDARFGDRELEALSGREEAGVGHRVMLSPILRARLGRVVARSQTDLAWYALSRKPGWYHESEYDTLLARNDWLVSNRSAFLVDVLDPGAGATLLLGPMYDVTRSGEAAIVRQRVGGVLFYAPAGARLGFDRLRVYALGGVSVSDRNRRGEPFGVLGVGGDLELARGAAAVPTSSPR